MKVKYVESIRVRMILYIVFSMMFTFFTDILCFYCIHLLKNDGNVNNGTAHNLTTHYTREIDYEMLDKSGEFWDIFKVTEIKNVNVMIIVVISLVLFFVYYEIISRSLVDDIHSMLSGIANIKQGDLYADIPVNSNDELGQLAISINEMKDSLRLLMEQERGVEQTKNDLITNVAHDLRTPLTSIRGYVDLLRKESISKENKEKYIQVLAIKTEQLQNLIESLFEYTKYYGEEIKYVMKPLNLSCFMEQITDEFYPDFQGASLQCQIDIEKDLYVLGDGEKLARAFNNILANAIKYGSDGKLIKVIVYRKKQGKKRSEVVVDTINYGRIIEEEDLKQVFEKFYRVENSRSLDTGGTGLGLAITKNIVSKHNGVVSMQSDANGTLVRVRLKEYVAEFLSNED